MPETHGLFSCWCTCLIREDGFPEVLRTFATWEHAETYCANLQDADETHTYSVHELILIP